MCLLDIVPRITTVNPDGKKAFGRGVTPDQRKRRKRLNTWKAGLVMHAHCSTGNVNL